MIGAAVEHMPLVGAEVQRLTHAFQKVSLELAGVLTALHDNDFSTTGTPRCDSSVDTAMRDLSSVLSTLRRSSTDCVSVMARHSEFSAEPGPAYGQQTVQNQPDTGEVGS